MLKIYCEHCGNHQMFIAKDLIKDKLNKNPWGDIICKKCHFVIATLSSNKECKINFVQQPLSAEANASTLPDGNFA